MGINDVVSKSFAILRQMTLAIKVRCKNLPSDWKPSEGLSHRV